VLAVRDNHDRCVFENPFEGRRIVHEHVAGRRAHECLDTAGLADLESFDLVDIAIGCAEIKTIVCGTTVLGHRVLVGQGLPRGGLRIHVRHVHEAGYATRGGGG
jgi:hypothetical protein